MRTLSAALLCLVFVSCASTQSGVSVPGEALEPVIDLRSDKTADAPTCEITIGVHNAAAGAAEFSLFVEWADATRAAIVERHTLPKSAELIEATDAPGVNVRVPVWLDKLPAKVVLVLHAGEATKSIELDSGYAYQSAGFYVAENGIGSIHRMTSKPDRNVWGFGR